MKDKHLGRQEPVFDISVNPETFIQLIKNKGVPARIMKSRKCPCATITGSPDFNCTLCNGEGYIYEFQKEMLQVDEDSPSSRDGKTIYPFRVPITKPVKVERLIPERLGGIKKYDIVSFTDEEIYINDIDEDYPQHYERKRVSYFFSAAELIEDEKVIVDNDMKILTTVGTLFDDEYKSGNIWNVHGDIVEVLKITDLESELDYEDYIFRKNRIYLKYSGEISENISVTYKYIPPGKALISELETVKNDTEIKWTNELIDGTCKIAFEPWYNLAEGDIITLLTPTLWKNEVLVHNTGKDKLLEFDIDSIDEVIFDSNGNKYYQNTDFILSGFRDIIWKENEPEAGSQISVRYGYHPTYIIWRHNPIPNTLENKIYPVQVLAKYYSKLKSKDINTFSQLNQERASW